MATYQHLRFPPRAELPPEVAIAKLPGVGRTWYKRGFLYWSRRVGNVLLLAGMVTMYTLVIGGVILAAGRPGSPGFLAVLAAEVVFSVVSGMFAFRHLWRIGISKPAAPAGPRTRAGVGAAHAVFLAGGLGALLLVVSVVLSSGFALAALAIWLVPVPPAERRARRLLAEEIAYYHHQGHPPRVRGGHKR